MGHSSEPLVRSRAGIVLLIIVSVAAALRVWHLTAASFWLDEFFTDEVASGRGYWMWDIPRDHVLTAAAITGNHAGNSANAGFGSVVDALIRSNHPPLYFLLTHAWIGLFGESDGALRMVSVVSSVLAIVFLFDAMRWLQGITPALCGAAAMALAGPQIQLAQEARGYALLVAMMLAACSAVARIERLGLNRRRLIALFAACFATVLTHYLGIAAIGAIAIYVAVRLRGLQRRRAMQVMIGAFLLAAALWGPFAWVQHDPAIWRLAYYDDGKKKFALLPWLRTVAALPVSSFSEPFKNSAAIAVFGAIVYVIPIPLLRRRPDLLLWWLILTVFIAILACGDLLHGTWTVGVTRYILPATVAVYALVVGVSSTLLRGRLTAMMIPAIAGLMTLNQAYATEKPDSRQLSAYAVDHSRKGELLAFYHCKNFSWGDQALFMEINHYAGPWKPSIVLLDRTAGKAGNTAITGQIYSLSVLLMNQSMTPPTAILPDHPLQATLWFPVLTGTAEFAPAPPAIQTAAAARSRAGGSFGFSDPF